MRANLNGVRLVESWIEEELLEDSGEPSGVYCVDRSVFHPGATPLRPSSLPPRRRASIPSDIAELSCALEGDRPEAG